MQRVMNTGPWSFDNYLLILFGIQEGEVLNQIPLFQATFWVQVHDVPTGFMSQRVGQILGNFIGQFVEYDANNNSSSWKSYIRIKVLVDVRKPLKRSKKISKQVGEAKVVKFKYERLGVFCFLCGCIGHNESFCDKIFDLENDDGV